MENNDYINKAIKDLTNIINIDIFNEIFFEAVPESIKLEKNNFPLLIYDVFNVTNKYTQLTQKDTIFLKYRIDFGLKVYCLNNMEAYQIATKLSNLLINNGYFVNIQKVNEKTGFNTTCLLLNVNKILFK